MLGAVVGAVARVALRRALAEAGEEAAGFGQAFGIGEAFGGHRKTRLSSTCISEAEYEDGILTVTFRESGNSYGYAVPPGIYEGLISAPSAGAYYNAVIKGHS